jgi:N-acetylglucosaminyldiphosphoundecaprenol N-acetyl-beta-D-mannosaminyltransferase
LRQRFAGLDVVGTMSPPYGEVSAAEDERIVAELNRHPADIIWVGLSTPKQERWMAAHRDRLAAPVLIGVGAAFDIHAGRIPQAPRWMQRSGTEWAYRLAREPRRLGRRYLVNNPRFVAEIIRRPPHLVV